jgi:type I restriction enzyme, S subunit
MGSDWQVVPFDKAPLDIIDGDRGKNYPKQEEFSSMGYCLFLNAGNVTSNGFNFSNCAFITEEKDQKLRKGKLCRNDVVLTTRGTVGNSAFFDKSIQYENIRINSGMVILRANTKCLYPRYLFFFVRSHLFHNQVLSLRTGSAQPQLPIRDINRIELPVPPLPQQRAIAHMLGTLDDKIELNRRMNETLEAMAQAIFKSWFVDFDPVIDNALKAGNPIPESLTERAELRKEALAISEAEGKTPGFPPHIANLFPDSFEETDDGVIPKGWKKRLLERFVKVEHGYAFKGKHINTDKNGDILITPGNFRIGGGFNDKKFKYYDGPVPEQFVLNMNDLLVTMTDLSKQGDTLGYPAIVPKPVQKRYLHNQRLGKVIMKESDYIGKYYLYSLFCTPDYRHHVVAPATGSTVKHTSPSRIKEYKFICPSKEIAQCYNQTAKIMNLKINQNNESSVILSEIRNILLPKLLSGELPIADAERFLEEIV